MGPKKRYEMRNLCVLSKYGHKLKNCVSSSMIVSTCMLPPLFTTGAKKHRLKQVQMALSGLAVDGVCPHKIVLRL